MRHVASTVDLVLDTVEGAHRYGNGIAVAQTVEERTVMSGGGRAPSDAFLVEEVLSLGVSVGAGGRPPV